MDTDCPFQTLFSKPDFAVLWAPPQGALRSLGPELGRLAQPGLLHRMGGLGGAAGRRITAQVTFGPAQATATPSPRPQDVTQRARGWEPDVLGPHPHPVRPQVVCITRERQCSWALTGSAQQSTDGNVLCQV